MREHVGIQVRGSRAVGELVRQVLTSPYQVASRYLGIGEVAGTASNPAIMAMLTLDQTWPTGDETPWCSAFANWICFQLGLPRSRSLAARSWLAVGAVIDLSEAELGLDVVILERDGGGHVGFYAGMDGDRVKILGGNQGDHVSVAAFPVNRVIGVRRLAEGEAA
jgi:uncharacterized protein (TIGR02594 family)